MSDSAKDSSLDPSPSVVEAIRSLLTTAAFERCECESCEQERTNVDALIAAVRSEASHEIARLHMDIRTLEGWLGECYAITGADPDDNPDSMLAAHAVEEVTRLRREFDAAEAQLAREGQKTDDHKR